MIKPLAVSQSVLLAAQHGYNLHLMWRQAGRTHNSDLHENDCVMTAPTQFRGAACFRSHREVTLKEKTDLKKKSHLVKALNCHYSQ